MTEPNETYVAVTERADDGRVLVATRDFAPGEVVLTERALVEWRVRSPAGRREGEEFFHALKALDKASLEAVLTMHRPAVEALCLSDKVAAKLCADVEAVQASPALSGLVAELSGEHIGGRATPQEKSKAEVEQPQQVQVKELSGQTNSAAGAVAQEPGPQALVTELLLLRLSSAHLVLKECADEDSPVWYYALFLLGGRAQHSCVPNVRYVSLLDSSGVGMLEYTAVRPIRAGAEVTLSYLPNLSEQCTTARQLLLLDARLFLCHCVLCRAPDPSSRLPCPSERGCDGGLVFECTPTRDQCVEAVAATGGASATSSAVSAGSGTLFRCSGQCGKLFSHESTASSMAHEAEYTRELDELIKRTSADIFGYRKGALEALAARLASSLSPSHWLVVKAYREAATANNSLACALEQELDSHLIEPGSHLLKADAAAEQVSLDSPRALRLMAAEATVCANRLVEHNVATALGQREAGPVYECAAEALAAGQDLLCLPRRLGVALLPEIQKYLQLMALRFGEDDLDVKEVADMLR